jgi:AraC-like DNA-binding protein
VLHAPRLGDERGTFWVFAPGEYHCGRVERERHWDYRGLYLDADALASLSDALETEHGRSLFVPPGLYEDRQLADVLLDVHRRAETTAPPLERQSLWTLALGTLFGRYGKPKPSPSGREIGKQRLALVREYIDTHFREEIAIDELARLCGVSRFHLIRSFRATYGIPPHAYLNQVRLGAARRLLAAGRSGVDAAADAGFYDQSVLARMFKRAFGITPREYAHLARR